MERTDESGKGTLVLATVRGDVHDIGKNLVDIILTNNGYKVINLGIKVLPEELIRAYREHSPDAIGLSGLLVKSAQQMVVTAGDFREAGVRVPLLVGGAALSDRFTRTRIAPSYNGEVVCYAGDAMTGLELMNRLMDPRKRVSVIKQHQPAEASEERVREERPESTTRSSRARQDFLPVPVPYAERVVRDVPQLEELWGYINPQMLYVRHMGFKGNFEQKLAERDPKALELNALIEDVKEEAAKFLKPRAV